MIKLFYDTNLRMEAESYQLFPLLEVFEMEHSPLQSHYKIVTALEDCDFGIVPMNIQFLYLQKKKREVENFIKQCQAQTKKVLVFSGGDFGVTIKNPNVITVRLGGFHSKLDNNTYIMPPFINDPYRILEKPFEVIKDLEKPTIGFVGHANGSIKKLGKEYLLHVKGILNRISGKDVTDKQSFYPSSLKRYGYLNRLLKSNEIVCHFIFRKQYRAGVKSNEEKQKTTREFYQNMNENLYTFCSRGTGNFSVRLYETLAMGRIPVVVDTDCRFPFNNAIPWKEQCVIILENEIPSIDKKINDFHKNSGTKRLTEIQKENRLIWQDYLTKNTYFKKFAFWLEQLKTTQ
ncbi:MAG: exostosin family protein [Flavobacteriaceae bacterium]